jgi:signal transduction histidine kinase/HAMP domain-containing protein
MSEHRVDAPQHQDARATKAVAGMRGGLGRILLTAFMLLAIVPLSVISYLAIRRVRADMRANAIQSLSRTAASVGAQLESWLAMQQYRLALTVQDATLISAVEEKRADLVCRLLARCAPDCQLAGFSVGLNTPLQECPISGRSDPRPFSAPTVLASVAGGDGRALGTVVASVDLSAFRRVARIPAELTGARVFVISDDGEAFSLLPEAAAASTWDVDGSVMAAQRKAGGEFVANAAGEAVGAAYYWLPGREYGILVERPEAVIRAKEDDFAAMLIGGTLAVALLTAVLAAVTTRQLTQPIVSLTMSAVRIAGGDLTQTVDLDRRDEIGILARAFNVMTAELRSLYEGLEQKVAVRTRQLVEANLELRYKAMQLKLSAEVGRIATSILDLELLLHRVTNLVQETYAHVYDVQYVSVWLQDEFGERLEREAFSGHALDIRRSAVTIGDDDILGQTAQDGRLRIDEPEASGTRVVIPLRIGDRTIGALDLRCAQRGALGSDDIEVLQSLGDQISVAIENARLYSAERDAVERLHRLDDVRLASLSTGSRELATELNTIIGFSRLILKGIDGPLTDDQRADLRAIYRSGYKLLGLIDNVITLSELEGGSLEIVERPVDVDALLSDVLSTSASRLPDLVVDYRAERPLPVAHGDPSLLRQAFVGLVMAVADQPLQELVEVHAHIEGELQAGLRVEIGGIGRSRRPVPQPTGGHSPGEVGIGVALARHVIALHGGTLELKYRPTGELHCRVELPLGEMARQAAGT